MSDLLAQLKEAARAAQGSATQVTEAAPTANRPGREPSEPTVQLSGAAADRDPRLDGEGRDTRASSVVAGNRLIESPGLGEAAGEVVEENYTWPHRYLFTTGAAGSGKTYLTRERVKQSSLGSCIVMASTGIAAVNLGDAVTINSQLGFFDTVNLRDNFTYGILQQRLRRLRFGGVRRLILDEISMTEAEQLTILVRALEELNGEVEVLQDPTKAMGLTVVGDWLQLPPVKGQFGFESPEWHRFHVETLTTMHRQSDPDFIAALRAARTEQVDQLIEYFRPRLLRAQDPDFPGTTILAKNAQVDRLNRLRHDALPGTAVLFPSARWGKERGEWKLIPPMLALKPEAQVMILANRYEGDGGLREILYANGDNGQFLGKDQGGNAAVLLARTGNLVTVKPVTRQHVVARKDPVYVCTGPIPHPQDDGRVKVCGECGAKVKQERFEVVGEITYLPLRLAYASTVHRTQGLTLDRVQVAISDPFFATGGMLYVALSRARTAEGLQVVGTVDQLRHRCKMDPRVKQWQ